MKITNLNKEVTTKTIQKRNKFSARGKRTLIGMGLASVLAVSGVAAINKTKEDIREDVNHNITDILNHDINTHTDLDEKLVSVINENNKQEVFDNVKYVEELLNLKEYIETFELEKKLSATQKIEFADIKNTSDGNFNHDEVMNIYQRVVKDYHPDTPITEDEKALLTAYYDIVEYITTTGSKNIDEASLLLIKSNFMNENDIPNDQLDEITISKPISKGPGYNDGAYIEYNYKKYDITGAEMKVVAGVHSSQHIFLSDITEDERTIHDLTCIENNIDNVTEYMNDSRTLK